MDRLFPRLQGLNPVIVTEFDSRFFHPTDICRKPNCLFYAPLVDRKRV